MTNDFMARPSRLFRIFSLLCCTWFCLFNLAAQQLGFSETYFFNARSTLFHAVRQFDNDLIVYGEMGTDSFGNNGVFVARIDTFGEVLDLRIFQDPGNVYNLDLSNGLTSTEPIVIFNNKIYLTGMFRYNVDLFMIGLDEKLDPLFFKNYESSFPYYRYVDDMLIHKNEIYTFGFGQTENVDFDLFIHKADLDGNQIWEKTFGTPEYNDVAATAIAEEEGITILASGWKDLNTTDPNDVITYNYAFHIDSSGEMLWSWEGEIDEEGSSTRGLLKRNNDYFYITLPGYKDDNSFLHWSPQIVCRDQSFNLKWRKNYGEFYFQNWFTSMTLGPDSFLYVAGYIPVELTWGRVCKIDPENGDLIWDARDTAFVIPGWGSRNRLEGLTVLPSGSIIAVGYTMDLTFHENGLLYKVTPDGCIDTLCTIVGLKKFADNPENQVRIFPNPAKQYVLIELPFDAPDSYIDIYTLDGKPLKHEGPFTGSSNIQIDITSIEPGMYVWSAITQDGIFIDAGKLFILPE